MLIGSGKVKALEHKVYSSQRWLGIDFHILHISNDQFLLYCTAIERLSWSSSAIIGKYEKEFVVLTRGNFRRRSLLVFGIYHLHDTSIAPLYIWLSWRIFR
ncbi:hypothetical protein M433DRAFT_367379 [Acidomyces richmondensis BFW]|nr:MAG: hypothetical protein FE78DRAFT_501318 [Acidomyces sp. 'richmondensis']KYG43253.1 hypothetical protein M433DRAFT_367379 [Acidomyces richmondensis BFW]